MVIIAVINSVISAYYYLRVVEVVWTGNPASEERVLYSGALTTALSLSSLGVLILNIAPSLIVRIAQIAAQISI